MLEYDNEITAMNKGAAIKFFEDLLDQGQQEGLLRRDINIRTAAFLIYNMLGYGLVDYLFDTMGISMQEYLNDPDLAKKLTEKEISHAAKQVMTIIRGGLAIKE